MPDSDSSEPTSPEGRRIQICAFWIGDHYCGITLDSVAEVAQALTVRAIPLAPNKVEGLALLRGNIINAINGRVCMGVEGRPPQGSFSYIVTQRAGETIAIGVDRVEDIVEVSPEQFSPPPSTLPTEQQALINGAYLLEKKLLVLLNPDELGYIPPIKLEYTPPPKIRRRKKSDSGIMEQTA